MNGGLGPLSNATFAWDTDAELDALIKSHLAKLNPALAERYTSETTCAELHALFADAQAERDHPERDADHA